ncbi:MAG: phage integrase SAM-like domain-containing protein, partial [Bacteroidota bacterium]
KSRQGIDDKSKAKYNLVLRRLKEVSGENLRFDQLNFAFLDKFDNHLITLSLSANSRKKHHDTLKSHINRAIKYGLFSKVNPYSQGYIVPSEEVKRQPISQDDLKKLEKLSFTKDLRRTEKVRDLFLFACRTGMRLDDLLNLDKENIRINGEEMYLTFKPRKSRSQWVIDMPLHLLYDGQPKQIVLKYLHTEHSVIFDHLQEGYVNLTLKKIAKMAGINRALHSHLGKITFITDMAQHHNVQVGLLSSLTGTTEKTLYKHYMKNDPKRRNKALKDIQWKK